MLTNEQVEDLTEAISKSRDYKIPFGPDIYSLLKRGNDGHVDFLDSENILIIRKELNNFKSKVDNLTNVLRKAEDVLTIIEKKNL